MKKLLIVGPGGLGGTIAALLARKGECDVTVVGRPGAHIDTIQRQRALRLTGLQEFTLPRLMRPTTLRAFESAISLSTL